MPVKSIFAAALALLGASSALAGPVPIGPAATAFKVGSIRVVALRDMINAIVRDELQGELGERINRNLRKLIRREIGQILDEAAPRKE